MDEGSVFEEQVRGIALLDDPVRRALYRYVVAQDHEVGREEAAAAVGVTRALAAFHLDKLTREGLLDVGYRRLSGRQGPGAGRPAKVYRRSPRVFAVTLPRRRYELLARLSAEALEAVAERGAHALADAGRRLGTEVGTEALMAGRPPSIETIQTVLDADGFEPHRGDDGVLRLRNCPFDTVARGFTGLVCTANVAFMEGLVDGLGAERITVALEPEDGRCCAVFRPR